MDLYNLFVSGEKIYKQVQKSPKELNYEDYLFDYNSYLHKYYNLDQL